MSYYRSPMNYVGGKYRLLPSLLSLFPSSVDRFIDLFCGGCSVGMNMLDRCSSVLCNDIDSRVIGIYESIRSYSDVGSLLSYIDGVISSYSLDKFNRLGYSSFRSYYNSLPLDCRSGIDLFILIAHSFNNNIRFNGRGDFNVPFGYNRSSFNSVMRSNLEVFYSLLQRIDLSSISFSSFDVSSLSSNDFVYCDPPYLVTCANYNENGGWCVDDELRLLSFLSDLDDRGIRFGLSNVTQKGDDVNSYLVDWMGRYNVHHLDISYGNCNYHKKDKSKVSYEVYVCNY